MLSAQLRISRSTGTKDSLLRSTFDDPTDLSNLSELGVLFLLFEMGLELSSDRLRALKTYAFGLGTVQVFVTTFAFICFAVPFGRSLGTGERFLLSHRCTDL